MRARLRRAGFGVATFFGFPRGFFIPSRYAAAACPQNYPALEPLFAAAEPRFRDVLAGIEQYRGALEAMAAGAGPARFDQDWFPRLDAAAAYALVRSQTPGRILEIGSGHSTRFLAQAVADGGLATSITCIDPAPRAKLAGLKVRHEARLFGGPDAALCADLLAGDMVFIDSSHVAMPGTDVDRLFLDGIPRLRGGILVHVHDVFLPDRYPQNWAWRGYNEQPLVGALLQGGAFEIVFSSHWVATRRPDWLRQGVLGKLALPPGAFETSLWMRKR